MLVKTVTTARRRLPSGHARLSRVSTPVVGFLPLALSRPHRYLRWSLRISTSLQSVFSIFLRSWMTKPVVYACVRSASVRSAFVKSAISRLHCCMFAPTNDEPARSASKKDAEKRFALSKLALRTTLCWKATPLRFSPFQSVLSRLTPRVIVIRRPDCSVDAPPPSILKSAEVCSSSAIAGPPTSSAAGKGEAATAWRVVAAQSGAEFARGESFMVQRSQVLRLEPSAITRKSSRVARDPLMIYW